ncbi:hypothetical protein BJ741DRAFT_592884 [Chytriomyces cf. hyalinus JEL632]|nr:hypothetical protein BJ741DRAFT_592884 [Chytriomyces cf. hyalinus JEL632]
MPTPSAAPLALLERITSVDTAKSASATCKRRATRTSNHLTNRSSSSTTSPMALHSTKLLNTELLNTRHLSTSSLNIRRNTSSPNTRRSTSRQTRDTATPPPTRSNLSLRQDTTSTGARAVTRPSPRTRMCSLPKPAATSPYTSLLKETNTTRRRFA